MKIFTRTALSGLAAATVLPLSALANDEPPLTIVITGSRTAQTADQTLVPVTVITRKDIEQKQAQTVAELLSDVPGVVISNNGGLGKATSIRIRGTESDHVLVLMDGVKIGSATTGTAAIQHIPVDLIDRIEVVRGPRASLYGSEAIGGVIQIFTRKGRAGFHPYASVGAGSHNTTRLNAGVSGGSDAAWFGADIASIDSDGFNACRGKPSPDGAGCFTDEPDDDGYNDLSFSLNGGARLGEKVTLSGRAFRSDAETEFDGSSVNESEATVQTLGLNADIIATDAWTVHLIAGQSRDSSDNFKDGDYKSRFDTRRDQFTFQNDVKIGAAGLLVAGVDYLNDSVGGTTDYAVTSRDNKAVFAQYQTRLGAHDVQFSLRNDDNEQFGNFTTGGVGVGHQFKSSRVTASYSTAFKAPTFNELYFPGFGNADLGVEKARSLNVGVSGDASVGRYTANLFHTQIDDLIAYDAAAGAPANIDEARITGLELTLDSELAGWDVATSLTFQNPQASSGEHDGNRLPRRAKNFGSIDISRAMGRLRFGSTIHARGSAYDDLANTRKLDGFTTVDVRGEYAMAKAWKLDLRINNLFDEEYETAAFYNQDGINGMLTLRYAPE